MPFRPRLTSGSADALSASEGKSVAHSATRFAAITEVARVLRRGGRCVGYDLTRTGANSAIHKFDGSQYLLITPSELAESFRAHGLDAKVRSFGFDQAMSFSATKPR